MHCLWLRAAKRRSNTLCSCRSEYSGSNSNPGNHSPNCCSYCYSDEYGNTSRLHQHQLFSNSDTYKHTEPNAHTRPSSSNCRTSPNNPAYIYSGSCYSCIVSGRRVNSYAGDYDPAITSLHRIAGNRDTNTNANIRTNRN